MSSAPAESSAQTAAAPVPAPAPAQNATASAPPVMVAPAARQPAAITRDTFNQQSLGPALNSLVKKARVLMVGAGGIGCELLKDLVLQGFGEVHIVDLDTIDLSNLNRQFLFRHEHIKKSKALVAKEVAHKFNPKVKIEADHANIKEARFNVEWFRGFTIVFNALDNLEARRHVNRMCLAADVPLIESGTTGFKGQVQVIKKGVTACYDCTAKETPKSFPVCTIRSTPSQPIHCIVWGKSYLLNEIFGASEDESAFDHSADQENAKEIEELRKESQELKKIRNAVGTDAFPQLLFDKVFNADVERLRSMEDMWKTRRRPDALDYKTLLGQASDALASKEAILHDGQKVWGLEENLVVFNDSLERLSKRILDEKKASGDLGPAPIITFDKDDDDTLDFVAASANIRSTIFGIERKSRFDIKQMAGNIIPAIATTNAIVAGLCVLEAFKVLKGDYSQAKEIFLTPFVPARLLAPDRPREPNPACPVCSVFQTSAFVDMSRATLNDLVEDFVRLELGYGEKELAVSSEAGILYDPDETENLAKKLSDLGIKQDSFLTITDEDDTDTFVNVVINIQETKDSSSEKPIKGRSADAKPEIPKKPKKEPVVETNGASQSNGKHVIIDGGSSNLPKRPREDAEPGEAGSVKKIKVVGKSTADDDLLVVDDHPGDGAIVIDDD